MPRISQKMSSVEKQYIEKIKESSCFQNKDTSSRLLDYLYVATKAERQLKELDIAAEFFKRKGDFNSGEDTIVRVNVFKLRQLLNAYYLEEGKGDQVSFSIPKRKYLLKIEETPAEEPEESKVSEPELAQQTKRQGYRNVIWALVLLISVILNLWAFVGGRGEEKARYHPVWSDFSESEMSNSIVLGNPLFYGAKNQETGSNLIVRNLNFNDSTTEKGKADLSKILEGYDVRELPYPYFSQNNVWALPELFAAVGLENPFIIKTKTETTVDDFNRGNVLFVSNINSFGFVEQFLSRTSLKLGQKPNRIILDSGEMFSDEGEGKGTFTEYGFFVKMRGENGNVIALLGDSNSTGIKGTINTLSDDVQFEGLMEKYGYTVETFPHFFEMIVKVRGYDYAGIESEVIYFKGLD